MRHFAQYISLKSTNAGHNGASMSTLKITQIVRTYTVKDIGCDFGATLWSSLKLGERANKAMWIAHFAPGEAVHQAQQPVT